MSQIKKAVVTGGAGFIGSHIVDGLIAQGIETIVLDDLSSGSMENLKQHQGNDLLQVVVGDISKIGSLLSDLHGVDVVFHEAAIASVPISVVNPLRVHDVNVTSTLHVMNFCVERGVKRFVFASSAAVYGSLDGRPASEDLICRPSSPYGASKLAVEGYVNAYGTTYGLETVALRYFNVYGPRQKMNDYSGVITVFADTLLAGRRPVIFGDGQQTRDFVHVKDIAKANLLAAQLPEAAGGTFNVASGEATSILHLLDCMKEITETEDISPRFDEPRRGDVRSGTASIATIQRVLGFRPSTSLMDGLRGLVLGFGRRTVLTQTGD